MKSLSEDETALRYLSNHIAKVKLEHEEIVFTLKEKLKLASKNQDLLSKELEIKKDAIISLTIQHNSLKEQNNTKYRVEERNEWKSLLHSVQEDRRRLESELSKVNNELMSYKNKVLLTATSPKGGSENIFAKSNGSSKEQIQINADQEVIVNLKNQLIYERAEAAKVLKEKEKKFNEQLDALRHRLDIELQAKWEREVERKEIETSTPYLTSFLFPSSSSNLNLNSKTDVPRSPQRNFGGKSQRKGKLLKL